MVEFISWDRASETALSGVNSPGSEPWAHGGPGCLAYGVYVWDVGGVAARAAEVGDRARPSHHLTLALAPAVLQSLF